MDVIKDEMRALCLSFSLFLLTRIPASVIDNSTAVGSSPGPHRHKHTTDWTNDTPQRYSTENLQFCYMAQSHRTLSQALKGWTTMGSLSEDTVGFQLSWSVDVVVFPTLLL